MKEIPKILLFSNTLWFLEKFKYELIRELSKNNKITCIYLRKGPVLKQAKINKLINSNKVSFYSLTNFIKKHLYKKTLFFLNFKFNNIGFQKIIIFNIGPIILSSILTKSIKREIIYVLEGMGRVFSSKGIKNLLIKKLVIVIYGFLFSRCERICVLNSYDALFLVENNICDINKIVLLPGTGINIKRINKEFKYKNSNPKYIDFIGRLIIEKGFYKFLFTKYNFSKYFPEFDKKYIFRIICPEEDINKLSKNQRNFLNKHQIQIKPYLSSAYDYYRETKALVVPSLYGEGLSRVVLEACYLEIPILASRSRGIQEVFPYDYKYFIKSYNPFSMSQQLAEMINDDNYFDELKQSIKLNIKKNYSTEIAIEAFIRNIFN